jgi:hypothetical protein
MAVQTKIQLRRDNAATWTSQNPTLAAGEIGFEVDTLKFKVGNGSNAWTTLKYSQDASLLTGDASLTSLTTTGAVTIGGDLTVNGTTTSINSSTLTVDDKNIELGSVAAITGRTGTATSGNTTITASNTAGMLTNQTITRTAGAAMTTGTVLSIINATAFTVSSAPSASGSITFDTGGATNETAAGAGINVAGSLDVRFIYGGNTYSNNWVSTRGIEVLSGQTYRIDGSTVLSATQVLGKSITDANTISTIVARDGSGNFSAGTITASLTGTASFATNLVGGTANKGEIVYQSGVNATAELTAPTTNNSGLFYNTATNAPFWVTPTLSNTYFGTTTTADQLRGALAASNTTGTGNLVFSNNATFVAPALGVATGTSVNVTGQLISTVTTGTAPLAVTSNTVVTNLNADLLDGFNTATAATANTVAVRDTNGSITANVFAGTTANVTGQLISTVTTGTAPLSVASTTRVTNLNAATAGVADSATIAGQANNITSVANTLIYVGATANILSNLAYSTANNGQYLGISSGQPAFITPAATGVTNVATGTGLTGGPITTTGTISINLASALTYTTTQRVNVSSDVLAFGIKANTTQTANLIQAFAGDGTTTLLSLSNVGTLFAVTIDGGSA